LLRAERSQGSKGKEQEQTFHWQTPFKKDRLEAAIISRRGQNGSALAKAKGTWNQVESTKTVASVEMWSEN
jgi:hypothetical protein